MFIFFEARAIPTTDAVGLSASGAGASPDIDAAIAKILAADANARHYTPQVGDMVFTPTLERSTVDGILEAAGVSYSVHADDRLPLVGRGRDQDDVVVSVGASKIGGQELAVIAGPCSVDTEALTVDVAKHLRRLGASGLRGGAFKPRTSPYAFEGHGEQGLSILASAREATGLPVVTEALDAEGAALVGASADAIQVGARTMQAFSLLHACGATGKPVVLKRGFGCTVDETLHAAEHLMAHGASGIVFVERGIRTFEQSSRFSLDLTGALRLKQRSRFPVLVDPSHAAGDVSLIGPLSRAAIAAGLDGMMVEVHADPAVALSDKHQALTIDGFAALLDEVRPIAAAMGRTLPAPSTSPTFAVHHAA